MGQFHVMRITPRDANEIKKKEHKNTSQTQRISLISLFLRVFRLVEKEERERERERESIQYASDPTNYPRRNFITYL